MSISPDTLNQVFSRPAHERYQLAQRLLDSIDDSAGVQIDDQFTAELRRRREEMMQGEQIIPDWRRTLSEIKESLSA
jgi:putative addiction module component (TIGR02574 family)